MKNVTAGNGADTTAAVLTWLGSNNMLRLANLYLIGEANDPAALWLTDYEAPLVWPCWSSAKQSTGGTPNAFDPAMITRGSITSQVGLDVESLQLTWSPAPTALTQSVATASPYQLAQMGYYDNWPVRVWTVYMPTPGDANTFGCSELFGGRIADTTCERGKLTFSVNSFLDVVNQYVPTNVIELLNTVAAYAGATPPANNGGVIPQFAVVGGDSTTQVNGSCTNSPGNIFNTNIFQHGYLVFMDGPGATLAGVWSAIQQNIKVNINGTYVNQFLLYSALPWPPTPGADTFYVSAASPINQADGDFYGFPYVPNPETAV
jgi:hypothetical protein